MNSEENKLNSIPDYVAELQGKNPTIPIADPNTIPGQLSLIYGEQHEKIKRLIIDATLNTSPLTARGQYLDNVIGNNFFVFRRGNTKAYVRCAFFGLPNTKIPKLTTVKNSFTGDIFELPEAVLLELGKAVQVTFNVKNFDNINFLIILNSARLEFVAKNAQEFSQKINEIFFNNQAVQLKNSKDDFVLESRNIVQTFAINVSDNIEVKEMANNFRLNALDFGKKNVAIGAADTLISTVVGINKVYNFLPGIPGAEREEDDDYRARGLNATLGKATPRAVRNAILQLEGVTSVSVINNTKPYEVDGVPANSIAPVVAGGFDDEIALAILDYKPGGIQSFGTTIIPLPNDTGMIEEIGFSRAEIKQVILKIKVILHPEEELLLSYKDDIINLIFAYANSLSVGDDVVLQRILGKVVSMQGVGQASVDGSLDGVNFVNTILRINRFQRAEFTKENIKFE